MSCDGINQQYCNCPPINSPKRTQKSEISNQDLEKAAFDELHEDVRQGRLTAQQADAMGSIIKAAINMQQNNRMEQYPDQVIQNNRNNI